MVGIRRRGCTYQKGDFLPEESFKTWDNYTAALIQTPHRLMDRMLTRSSNQAELDARARSQTQMRKTLTWWDLIWDGDDPIETMVVELEVSCMVVELMNDVG
ncbi:hypothetical protein L6452_19523 [Arctium lappa]|uniref:Uncharacterized protein n=1 Tax=Arctium lappa TaxID=4217 RepID=A0ACB9B9Q9_ARCLA|nr:hypothetical protein L6452_19523 [Arctium lappa]